MNYIFASIISIAILYAWGGLIFAFWCVRFDGSEGQKRFLERNFLIITQRFIKPAYSEITPKVLRDKEAVGWGMVGLPMILLGFGFTFLNVTLSTSLLFFGGLAFARSWYGLRCLRCLGLDSFAVSEI